MKTNLAVGVAWSPGVEVYVHSGLSEPYCGRESDGLENFDSESVHTILGILDAARRQIALARSDADRELAKAHGVQRLIEATGHS